MESLAAFLDPYGTTQKNLVVVLRALVGLHGRVVDASYLQEKILGTKIKIGKNFYSGHRDL